MVIMRRWLSWAFVSLLMIYGPILIFNTYYKSDSPSDPDDLVSNNWYTQKRAGMTVADIEKQAEYIDTERTSPGFAAGSPLDRLQEHRNTQKSLNGR